MEYLTIQELVETAEKKKMSIGAVILEDQAVQQADLFAEFEWVERPVALVDDGIGIGEGVFAAVYPSYALHGIETAPHSHSLYLQILTELGISGAVIFSVFLFILVQMNLSHIASPDSKSGKMVEVGIFCGLVAFLVQGVTDYVWYNYRIFLMFWITVGLSVGAVLMSKNALDESSEEFFC